MAAKKLPSGMLTVREYLDLRGRNPWEEWFENLEAPAAAQVTTTLVRNAQGDSPDTSLPAPAKEGNQNAAERRRTPT